MSDRTRTPCEYLTPPQVAKRLAVSCEKVIGWLLAGELRGCDLASKGSKRPRYRIAEADLQEFLERRSAAVAPAVPRRRKPARVGRFY